MMDTTGSVEAKSSTFIWKINNFSKMCTKYGECIVSPFFTAGEISSNTIKWQMILYPFGRNEDCKDFVSIYLACFFCGDVNECDASFGFELWTDESTVEPTNYSFTGKFESVYNGRGINEFISRNELEFKDHLSSENDTLRIACYISNIATYFAKKLDRHTELIESFDLLFLSDRFSDVTIEVENKELKAHKNILAARSEVFSAMLKHNTVESNESVIRITDISYDVMKEVLRFIYCGKIENLQTHKEDLLVAANKYNITLLKKICEQSLWNNVNVNNVCEILSISDLCHCDGLKTKAVYYLINHLKEVVHSPGFKQLTDSNPNLLAEILREAAENYEIIKNKC